MGSARAPVVGSGLVPAWICRVSKLQLWGVLMRRLLSSRRARGAQEVRPCPRGGRPGSRLFPWSTSDGVEVAGQPARCFALPLRSQAELYDEHLSHVKQGSQLVGGGTANQIA